MKHPLPLLALGAALLVPDIAGASNTRESPGQPASGTAAFLFVYRVKPEAEALFDQAYRRHLDWHRRHGDQLPWYAWYISGGPRAGMFVDGTFGVPFAALDTRVSPREDATDFAQTAGAFSEGVDRKVYRLRRDLSTATPLESRAPAQSVDVLEAVVAPGGEREFEDALARARNTWRQQRPGAALTCYQLVAGGEHSSYLIMISRSGWGLYDGLPGSALDLLFGARLETSRRELERLRRRVLTVHSETWTYRPDLTLLPGLPPRD